MDDKVKKKIWIIAIAAVILAFTLTIILTVANTPDFAFIRTLHGKRAPARAELPGVDVYKFDQSLEDVYKEVDKELLANGWTLDKIHVKMYTYVKEGQLFILSADKGGNGQLETTVYLPKGPGLLDKLANTFRRWMGGGGTR